jgi:opacity protein-like surface antigen
MKGIHMNFCKKALVLSASLMGSVAFADEASKEASNGGFYLGLKAGSLMIDVSGIDNATMLGFQAGYDMGNKWSLEFEYTAGEAEAGSIDIDATNMAAYATFRSEGQGYFLGKVGLLKEELEGRGFSESESGLSYGFGGGFNANKQFAIEAEYTIVEADASLIAVTGRMKF